MSSTKTLPESFPSSANGKREHERIVIFLLFLTVPAVRIFQACMTQVINVDSVTIVEAAKGFENLGGISLRDLAVNVHPLFPFFVSLLVKLGLSYELAGKTLSIFFGSVTVFPLYWMGKKAYGQRAASFTVFLYSFHPYLFADSANLLRDSTTIFFMVVSVFLSWKGFEEKKYRFFFLSGFTSALAYLTKAEGLFCIIIILTYIWVRRDKIKGWNLREKLSASLSFLSLSLVIAVPFIAVLSSTSHAFTVSIGKSFGIIWGTSEPGANVDNVLEVLLGFRSGSDIVDMVLAFLGSLFEAIFLSYIPFLAANLLRHRTGQRLSSLGGFLLFFVGMMLVCDLSYLFVFHLFSRRYFLISVTLLMVLSGYGMKLIQDVCLEFDTTLRKARKTFAPGKLVLSILALTIVVTGLFNGAQHWEYDKVSLKLGGKYILDHFSQGRTILTDDPRLAYYAEGKYTPLTEDDVMRVEKSKPPVCPYEFIVFSQRDNFWIYEKYKETLLEIGYRIIDIQLPPGDGDIYILQCSEK